jgi:hypothetical protein
MSKVVYTVVGIDSKEEIRQSAKNLPKFGSRLRKLFATRFELAFDPPLFVVGGEVSIVHRADKRRERFHWRVFGDMLFQLGLQ